MRPVVRGTLTQQGKRKMTTQQRKQLAGRIEQEIGDLLRAKQIKMDGYMCREVETIAKKLAFDAILKREPELAEKR